MQWPSYLIALIELEIQLEMKTLFILIIGILLTQDLISNTIDKVPKQYSIEMGYRMVSANDFEGLNSMGTTILFDYAWQLSGFISKKPSYISVPLGYTYLFHGKGEKSARILSYGWSVRHDLLKEKSWTPFIGYSLVLNQLSIESTEGQLFGHQTKFDFGLDHMISEKLTMFTKIEYSMTRYPQLEKESSWMRAYEFKFGLRF